MSTNKCPICKKVFEVTWPQLWAYKKDKTYYCSWKCLQEKNKKKKESVVMARTKSSPKMTKDMQQILIDLSINGGDYLGQLRAWGYTDPNGTMYKFRKKIEKEDPETYAKMQTIRKRSAEPAKKDPHVVELTEEEFAELSKPKTTKAKVQGPIEVDRPTKKVTKPLMHSGLTACGWRGEFGSYIRDEKQDFLDADLYEGDLISMKVEDWKRFLKELYDAAALLGVDLHE